MKTNVKSIVTLMAIAFSVMSCSFFKGEKPTTDGVVDSTKITNGDSTTNDTTQREIEIDSLSGRDSVSQK
jgi:hypothetical protein